MIIRDFNIEQLNLFIESDEFKNSDVIPITTLRAISHINNPRADKEDIILIVAFDNDDIIGYIGILPDKMYKDNKEIKFGWISNWWSDNNKGKAIALDLFFKALDIWDRKILITDLIPHTKFIVDKTEEFFFADKYFGLRCFLRFNLSILIPSKFKSLKHTAFLFKIIDFMFNTINDLRILYFKPKLTNTKLQYINNIDDETNSFIKQFNNDNLFKRDKEEINWIINYPWISDTNTSKIESKKYYFSSYSKIFDNKIIKIYNNSEFIGLLIFSNRNKHLKIPYIYFDKINISIIVDIIYNLLITFKINVFTTFNPSIVEYINNNPYPFYYKRKQIKDIAISIKYKELNLNSVSLQDGDGDCAFT